MGGTLFSVTGCSRCALAKKFLRAQAIPYEELDALGEGKARFATFYRAHRDRIVRGREGVEFPVWVDGEAIRQGIAPVLAWLQAGVRLDPFFRYAESPRGWAAGIEISAGDPAAAEDLFAVLAFLQREGIRLEIATDGRNAALLEGLLARGLADRVVMRLWGPPEVHRARLGETAGLEEIEASMVRVPRFPEYRFETVVAHPDPGKAASGGLRGLTPEEIAATARWLKEVTGSHRHPYVLIPPAPLASPPAGEPPPPDPGAASLSMVRLRSAARVFQVLTEIASRSEGFAAAYTVRGESPPSS